MSAQRVLVDWLADRGKCTPSIWAVAGGMILAEHGPAIAELIEAAHLVGCFPSDNRLKRLAELVAKLTDPKA